MKKPPQVQTVLKHLRSVDPKTGKRRGITALEALGMYNVFRLADVIYKLKGIGHKIRTDLRMAENGKRYARYFLEDEAGTARGGV